MGIRIVDLNWVAIDEGDNWRLPPPKYRRFIRVAILTRASSNIIHSKPQTFWAFVDRQTSTFYVEEVIDPPGYLKLVEPQELFDELWEVCRLEGLLNIIIPAEKAPMIHFDRRSALDHAHSRYMKNKEQWQKAELEQR